MNVEATGAWRANRAQAQLWPGAIIMQQPRGHNTRLRKLLVAASLQIAEAKTEGELIAVLDNLKSFGAPLRYDNTLTNLIGAAALFGALVVAVPYLLTINGNRADSSGMWVFLGV